MKNNYLALGGLFASLHVLFLFLSKVIVGSEILLVLFLPLLSTLYTMKSDKQGVVMFVIATILICSIFDVIGTFIYVVPSLVCGVLYGFLRKKNFKELDKRPVSEVETSISESWKSINEVHDAQNKKNENNETFVFYDGPAFANGFPGLHHMVSKNLNHIMY